jgi:hypothetical protein
VTGADDLARILSGLTVTRRAGTYVYVSAPSGSVSGAAATIAETEGTTYILEQAAADRAGLEWSFAAAWLTVEIQTALDAIGVTAALAGALAGAGIPGNVLAGFHHDHLLVPVERADDAISVLHGLREHPAPSSSTLDPPLQGDR